MAGQFTIKLSGRLISKNLKKNYKKQILKEMKALAEDGKKQIIKRTKAGKNEKGQNFPRYTPAYAKYKRKLGLSTSPVNLTLTGKMLNSIETRVDDLGNKIIAEITLNDDRRKVEGVEAKRPFFGLSKEFKKLFAQLAKKLNINEANR